MDLRLKSHRLMGLMFVCLFIYLFLFCIGVCAYMCVCAPFAFSAGGGQKRAPDPLKLESQMVVSHHEWVLGIKPRSFARVVSDLYL